MLLAVPLDPGNVTIVNVQAEDTSALVTWLVESQDACSGITVKYTVVYSSHDGRQFSEATTHARCVKLC